MEIIDKYIYAIGQKLPLKGREEIKQELKSLILDEIEEKYGTDPTPESINQAISDFGTPGRVAKKYIGTPQVISSGFTDLYFMILKIIVGSIGISFFTIFIVNLFTTNPKGIEIFRLFIKFPINTIQASISGIGFLTVIFIIITKFLKDKEVDLEEDWSVKELESITLSKETESKVESIIAIILIPIFITLINLYPDFIQLLENQFLKSGLSLGNRINMDVFSGYIYIFSALGLLQVYYHFKLLKKEIKTKSLYILDFVTSLSETIFMIIILSSDKLFIYNGVNNGLFSKSTLGIKLFIVISLVAGIGELISKLINYIKSEVVG